MNMEKAEMKVVLDKGYYSVLIRTVAVFAVVIIAALLVAFIFGKRIVAPLKKIQNFAQKISEGNLTTSVDVKQRNEIGQTAEALRIAQDNMRGLLQAITEVSNGVGGALGSFDKAFNNMKESISQVSVAVDSIAENVTRQASSTDEANDDVGIMGDKINQDRKRSSELRSKRRRNEQDQRAVHGHFGTTDPSEQQDEGKYFRNGRTDGEYA